MELLCESVLHLVVVLHIDFGFLPLASRDMTIEQDVNLTVGSILHLGQVKVCRDPDKQSGERPDVAGHAAKVSTLHYVSNCHHKTERKKSPTVGLSI